MPLDPPVKRVVDIDFSEARKRCDVCDGDTRHRVTTITTVDDAVRVVHGRCLEHDEDDE